MKIGIKLSLTNAVVVLVVMAISITFLIMRDIKQRKADILRHSRLIVEELKITRQYLADSLAEFDDTVLDGKMSSFIPARAGYEISKKFTEETGYILKQTSLKLRNPENAPDAFESRILQMFEGNKHLKEYWEIDTIHGEKFFRYMFPLFVKEACLKCHGIKESIPAFIKETYKEDTATDYHVGDIRGALSLKVPYNTISKIIWEGFWYLIIVACITTGTCIGVVFSLSKIFISSPLGKLYRVVENLARGDLKQSCEIKNRDEVGHLAGMVNKMKDNLAHLVNKNKEVIAQIATSSSEILATNEEQAGGAGEVAASVSEVTATMEEMSATSGQIASISEKVNKSAEDSTTAVQQGKEAVIGSMNTMENIMRHSKETIDRIFSLNEKSRRIGEILEIVHEVSREIHLLSLNAAIEASGAGEHGKRFGVVAGEIRKLVERTRNSTEEIRKIINETQVASNAAVMSTEQEAKMVSQGVEIVKTAVHTMEIILELIEKTTDASKQIVMATRQQKSATEQVAGTMHEISEVVKQTAAGLKQSSAALGELTQLAKDLEGNIKEFKT